MFSRLLLVALALFTFVVVHPVTARSQARSTVQTEPVTASAAYIKLGTIKGEATERNHKEWIEIVSYSFGANRPAATGAAPTGPGTLTITKVIDKASPLLKQPCTSKQSMPEVVVHLPAPRGQGLVEYVLRDVVISSCSSSGQQRESVSLNYQRIEMRSIAAEATLSR